MAVKVSEEKLSFIFTPDGFIPDIDNIIKQEGFL